MLICYKGAGAGAKCDHQRIGVRARVRANIDLDVRGACVRRKKPSQPTPWTIFNSSHYSKDKSSKGPLSSTTISDSFYSLMDQDLIVKWWEEIWQRSSHDNTFLSEFDPSPYSYEDTSFIGT